MAMTTPRELAEELVDALAGGCATVGREEAIEIVEERLIWFLEELAEQT